VQLPKGREKRQIGIGLIKWETKLMSLEYLKLGKSRKQLKWLIHISTIDKKRSEILQNRDPMGLEKVDAGK